jgi:hypothetical protein
MAAAGETRLPLILLAQIAADVEQTMYESTWRNVNPRWFRFLASTGYTLADVEQRVVNDADDRNAQGGPDSEAGHSDDAAGPDTDDVDGHLAGEPPRGDDTEGCEAA